MKISEHFIVFFFVKVTKYRVQEYHLLVFGKLLQFSESVLSARNTQKISSHVPLTPFFSYISLINNTRNKYKTNAHDDNLPLLPNEYFRIIKSTINCRRGDCLPCNQWSIRASNAVKSERGEWPQEWWMHVSDR